MRAGVRLRGRLHVMRFRSNEEEAADGGEDEDHPLVDGVGAEVVQGTAFVEGMNQLAAHHEHRGQGLLDLKLHEPPQHLSLCRRDLDHDMQLCLALQDAVVALVGDAQVQGGGAGSAFAWAGCWGRVSPALAASPRHPVSLFLAWNSSVLGELSRGREQSRRS